MRIAIMQPAFLPPASYFRLFAASDLFVIYDDVQFSRRWYTHRQKLTKKDGTKDWFTLPIKKTDRDTTRIMDLEWAGNAYELERKQDKKFPVMEQVNHTPEWFLRNSPMDIIVSLLRDVCTALDIEWKTVVSSHLKIPESVKGQDRIIAICKQLGATSYINSPGGRELYNEEDFTKEGTKLTFLPEYKGSYDSIIERLKIEDPVDIRKEIMANI